MKLFKVLGLILMVTICMSILQGCGNGGTSGSISMTDLTSIDMTGGNYKVTATVTFTPPSGRSSVVGEEVNFAYSVTGATTHQATQTIPSSTSTLGSNGTANLLLNITQVGEAQILQVTATVGGLSAVKSVTIPSL